MKKYGFLSSIISTLYLYITLLVYANKIPHKFDNTLVSFHSAFGVAFICILLHIADTLLCIYEKYNPNFEFLHSFHIQEKVALCLLFSQLCMNIPLFVTNVSFQNITPTFGIMWIFQKNIHLLYIYTFYTLFSIFISTFHISMMKQTKYETPSEISENVFYILFFIFDFVCLGLLYIIHHSEPNDNAQNDNTPKVSLKSKIETIQTQNKIVKNEKTEHSKGKFVMH